MYWLPFCFALVTCLHWTWIMIFCNRVGSGIEGPHLKHAPITYLWLVFLQIGEQCGSFIFVPLSRWSLETGADAIAAVAIWAQSEVRVNAEFQICHFCVWSKEKDMINNIQVILNSTRGVPDESQKCYMYMACTLSHTASEQAPSVSASSPYLVLSCDSNSNTCSDTTCK